MDAYFVGKRQNNTSPAHFEERAWPTDCRRCQRHRSVCSPRRSDEQWTILRRLTHEWHRINVDASLIKQTHRFTKTEEKVIALQNGCICCTLRGDLLKELLRLAELEEFDYVIIESSGISEPEQVTETFDKRLAEQMSTLADEPEGVDEDMINVLRRL